MSRGKLDKETAARVEKELPYVLDVRTASLHLQPDFISMGFPPGSNIPIATVCLQDATSMLEEARYALLVQIKGKVTILNHPELGKTVASGMCVIFQREDCKKCLIATRANLDGDYEVFLGEGRYKVIAWENRCDYGGTGCICYDLLAPDQPRYVEAKRSPYPTEFNISIRLPKK